MTNSKKSSNLPRPVWLIPLALIGVGLVIKLLSYGSDAALLTPRGQIAHQQLDLMMFGVSVLLAVAIPTLFVLYFFAWKYRESDQNLRHDPEARRGQFFALGVWVIPALVVGVLALRVLPATVALDPHKAIASDVPPITIQVVAMRWKWLFIYPSQNIATVNFVQIPINTPVRFELTADEVSMSSFWIPHLGGQLYAMTGMDNRLNLLADTPGDYNGGSAEINGAGFSGMKFMARASSKTDFDAWVNKVKRSSSPLDSAAYSKVLAPSQSNPATFYSSPQTGLFEYVVLKYMSSSGNSAVSL